MLKLEGKQAVVMHVAKGGFQKVSPDSLITLQAIFSVNENRAQTPS